MRTACSFQLRAALAAALVIAPTAAAQGAPTACSGPSTGFSSCPNEEGVFQYLAPQLGALLSAGSPTPTRGGALGRLGRFDAGLDVKVLGGSVPDLRNYNSGFAGFGFSTRSLTMALPMANAAVALYPGHPLGVTRIGGVDILGSATWLRGFDGSGTSFKLPDGALGVGYGARVGLLEEGLLTPGIGFTYVDQRLPAIAVTGGTNAPFSGTPGPGISVQRLAVRSSGWRVTASKSLIVVGASLAAGQDRFRSSADIYGETLPVTQRLTRTNYSASAWATVAGLRLVGQLGRVTATRVPTTVMFSGTGAGSARTFGSIGVRSGW